MSLRESHSACRIGRSQTVRKGVLREESQSRSDMSYRHCGNVLHCEQLEHDRVLSNGLALPREWDRLSAFRCVAADRRKTSPTRNTGRSLKEP